MIFRVGSLPTPGKCAYNYLCCLETYALKTLNNIAGAYLSFWNVFAGRIWFLLKGVCNEFQGKTNNHLYTSLCIGTEHKINLFVLGRSAAEAGQPWMIDINRITFRSSCNWECWYSSQNRHKIVEQAVAL